MPARCVMTVLGPIAPEAMGITLMHEHLLIDSTTWWHSPASPSRMPLAYSLVSSAIYGELRMDPFVNLDNCRLDDVNVAIEEVQAFKALGGHTVVDPTCRGIGRDPAALQAVARATGLHIIMGTGFYLEPTHPPDVKVMSIQAIEDLITADVGEGVEGVRAGIIGEIGVGGKFTPEEQKVLRGAARAQRATGVPLTVHLPGWARHGERVLDLVAEEGGDLARTVLDHMNLSLDDPDYQMSLADRGVYLEYDMIGMDYFYADQQAQSPCDEENARALHRLIDQGYIQRLLLSQDVCLKMMLTRHGGFGYGHILRHFVPRLRRHGVTDAQITTLLVENPRRLFGGPVSQAGARNLKTSRAAGGRPAHRPRGAGRAGS
jgi:phosphotriesterase-related protein